MEGLSKLVLVLATAAIVAAHNSENKTYEDRVIGGLNAQRGDFPFIVSIERNNQFICGGSILSQSWIVSAAHCFYGYTKQDQFAVFAGLLNQDERYQNSDVQKIQINQIYIHQEYQDKLNFPNDIAMARLATPLRFSCVVQNINLPREDIEMAGSNAISIGWGITETGQPANTLKYMTAPILHNDECDKLLPGAIIPSQICTFYQSACISNGDSGGPLVQNNVIIGITSWAMGTGYCTNDPSVYTRVSSFRRFIDSHLSQ